MIIKKQCIIRLTEAGYMAMIDDFGMMVYPCFPVDDDTRDYLFYIQFLENDRLIYAFDRVLSLKCFLKLIDIQGIGCRLASRILQALPYDLFARAVASNDLSALSDISGVSVKLAHRILDAFADSEWLVASNENEMTSQGYLQARTVLKSLDLPDERIQSILASIIKDNPKDPTEILKAALQQVNYD